MAIHRSVIKRNARRKNRSKKTSRFHPDRYRLVISRSLKNFMAQIINDHEGKTILSVSSKDKDLKSSLKKTMNKIEISKLVGEIVAKKAKKAKIDKVVLDRNGYTYHGRVKAFADAARKGGLEF